MESEKEKMGTGRLYDANYDTELIAERQACKELCYTLNHLPPSQIAEREAIIRRLFCKTKLLQKSGIRKNEVIELIYRGFI